MPRRSLLIRWLCAPAFWLGAALAAAWAWQIFAPDRPVASWSVGEQLLRISPDYATLLATSLGGDIRKSLEIQSIALYDLATGREQWRAGVAEKTEPTSGAEFSPDGRFVVVQAAAVDRYTIRTYCRDDGRMIGSWSCPWSYRDDRWTTLGDCCTPNGSVLIRPSFLARCVYVVALPECRELATLTNLVEPFALHPSGRSVAGRDPDTNDVIEVNVVDGSRTRYTPLLDTVEGLAWDPSGGRLAASGDESRKPIIRIWERGRPAEPVIRINASSFPLPHKHLEFPAHGCVTLRGNEQEVGNAWDLRFDPPRPLRTPPPSVERDLGDWSPQVSPDASRILMPVDDGSSWAFWSRQGDGWQSRRVAHRPGKASRRTWKVDGRDCWSADSRRYLFVTDSTELSQPEDLVNWFARRVRLSPPFEPQYRISFRLTDTDSGQETAVVTCANGSLIACDLMNGRFWTWRSDGEHRLIDTWQFPSPWPRPLLAGLSTLYVLVLVGRALTQQRNQMSMHPHA